MGAETERIQALYDFEESDLFTDAEKIALLLVKDASKSPNETTPAHFVALRKHYSDEQIIEIMAVSSLAGWLNKWNDTVATVTDQESVDFANENLAQVGWESGKHVGEAEEQRKGHPRSVGWVETE